MNEVRSKSFKENYVAPIIVGIILLGISALFPGVRNLAKSIWEWCSNKLTMWYSLPGWAWLIVLIFAVLGLIVVIFSIYVLLNKGGGKDPVYSSYVEDRIHGAVWRWDWSNSIIYNLWCFCPTCDATLVYDDIRNKYDFDKPTETYFICENCGHKTVSKILGDKDRAIGVIKREIERRVRQKKRLSQDAEKKQ